MKLTIFALMLAITNPSVAEVDNSILINKVGTFKIAVYVSGKATANVIITDANNAVVHQEYVSNNKLFDLNQLVDGKYTMTVLDSYKKVVEVKSFEINTQVKKELVIVK